jgi:hypothetical protein
MLCPRCQAENPSGMRFCGQCAAPLASACAACGTANPAGNRFCGQCAAPLGQAAPAPKFTSPDAYTPRHLAEKILTSKAALEGERKQVTVLFADLKGSMELLADRDPEETRKLLFAIDVLACPRCGGRRRLVGVPTGGEPLRARLERLGLGSASPSAEPSRSPPRASQ